MLVQPVYYVAPSCLAALPLSDAKKVDAIVRNAYSRALELVGNNKAKLDQLVEQLLRTEALGEEDLVAILGPRSTA